MAAAFRLLLLSICISPASLLFDEAIVSGLVAAVLAAGIATAALAMPPGEAGHLQRSLRPVAIIVAVPAAWMLVQILPLKFIGLAHPIWASAGEALGRPVGGGISIDPGATLVALSWYLSAVAGAFLAAAVAIDRQRSKLLLFTLTGASTLVAIVAIFHDLTGAAFLSRLGGSYVSSGANASAALGVIFSAAAATQRLALDEPGTRQALMMRDVWGPIAILMAFAVCWIELILSAKGGVLFAAACGLATVGAIVAIRRFDIGSWGAWAIAATGLIVVGAIVAVRIDLHASDATLALAGNASRAMVGIAQRILADASWTGAGAGNFSALLPIYRGADDMIVDANAPTAAAGIVVEMGRPMLIAILIAAFVGIIALLRGALARGRDSSYPAAGAGCLVTLSLQSFSDAGLFNTAVSTMAAAAIGLALIQRASRTSR